LIDIEHFDVYAFVMGPPPSEPIGLQLSRTAKLLSRAFDEELAAAGGSVPVWLVLVSLKAQRHGLQRELAEAVGVEGPTLTHHLNKMEAAGLVTRTTDPQNRRVHRVELTEQGEAVFVRLRQAAMKFDRRLRAGITDEQFDNLTAVLGRLRLNAGEAPAQNQELKP
jgi:MarR family transcriptional regulator for hemolysin